MRRLLPLLALAALSAAGCQQFFTYSVAKAVGLARPAETITTLDASSASAFVQTLTADPDPARAATAINALATLVSTDTTPSVIKDAASVAVIATGLDTALTKALTSIDVQALMSGSGTPSTADLATLADIISASAAAVTPQTAQIFEALATSAAADPLALAGTGIGTETFAVAAAALALNDMNTQTPPVLIADVINGTATYTPDPALAPTLANLVSGASAVATAGGTAESPLLSTLQGFLHF